MKEKTDIRPSPIAGQWYSSDPRVLASEVDGYINNARAPRLEGDVVAVVAPHAGHLYSGQVAGYAFAVLKGISPEVVVVVSPMHHPYYEELLTTKHAAYETPLGIIPVDRYALEELSASLETNSGIRIVPVARDSEHSIEIELPFLQRALGNPFRILPVMVRDQSVRVARALGNALADLFQAGGALANSRPLFVASTDLSHFYTQTQANALDQKMLEVIKSFDPERVIKLDESGEGFACGRGAVAAVLWATKNLGADSVHILHYATSGDVSGDYSSVVGYGSAVVTREKNYLSK
ncbi:MAG: AmmeMemoRadiSam system protein B [Anaerolineales bacterium]|jgi:AmmeMemoRadiSam system protein B